MKDIFCHFADDSWTEAPGLYPWQRPGSAVCWTLTGIPWAVFAIIYPVHSTGGGRIENEVIWQNAENGKRVGWSRIQRRVCYNDIWKIIVQAMDLWIFFNTRLYAWSRSLRNPVQFPGVLESTWGPFSLSESILRLCKVLLVHRRAIGSHIVLSFLPAAYLTEDMQRPVSCVCVFVLKILEKACLSVVRICDGCQISWWNFCFN